MRSPRHARPGEEFLDYPALADLRYQLRRFIRVREVAARQAGVEPQQYLALLQIKGLEGRQLATIGVLSERLQIRHHAAVQLVDRLASQGLAERQRTGRDRREVVVLVSPAGEKLLRRLARQSLDDLATEGPRLLALLNRLVRRQPGARVPAA
jgi:DNA-binding MarR family transcriptional regulator